MTTQPNADRSWISYIDSIDLYPIQFANCDRLLENNAVYLFDEVGCGKTISSGLMALDYLVNNPEDPENPGKNVLVITTNALVKSDFGSDGQFLKDWYEKLPFRALGLTHRIKVINNYYSNIKQPKNCGLIIVDEAQLFLNTESKRFDNLYRLRADKIVFLTATPIKTSPNDLSVYVKLAREITRKPDLDDRWIGEISTNGKDPKSVICSVFNVKYPVTRYFKDTIMTIDSQGKEGENEKQARRLIPQLWEYENGKSGFTKKDILLKKMNECFESPTEKEKKDRFVIFTRYVESEAVKLGEFLEENGYCSFEGCGADNCKTYKIVTGKNGYELSKYSGFNDLPDVLILTYQIAEQGVNLPGYNHVVNYHISAFPSALEQRFGRIDRMTSAFSKINMCFLISSGYWDTNTWNFYSAISVYLQNLISYLPSKNTILSEEIILKYIEKKEYIEKYIEKIIKLAKDEKQAGYIAEYFTELHSNSAKPDNTGNRTLECGCDKDLFDFIYENSIEIDVSVYEYNKDEAFKQFKESVKDTLAEYRRTFSGTDGQSSQKLADTVRSLGDKVFYRFGGSISDMSIRMIDAVGDCGKTIAETDAFRRYKEDFEKKVRLPLTVSKYRKELNRYFEDKFIENDFYGIFPYEGYKTIFESILSDDIDREVRQLLIDNRDIVVSTLPFFKMCRIFEDEVQNIDLNERYGYNPIALAFYRLYVKVRQSENRLGLSEKFFKKYFDVKPETIRTVRNERVENRLRDERFGIVNKDGIIQATNWYKLAYHYTRREAWYYDKVKWKWCCGDDNRYAKKERLVRYLAENYEEYRSKLDSWSVEQDKYDQDYKAAMDGEASDFDPKGRLQEAVGITEPEKPDIIDEYEAKKKELKEIVDRINKLHSNEKEKIGQSLFNFYHYTEYTYKNKPKHTLNLQKDTRKHSFEVYIPDGRVYLKDVWTKGILYELNGTEYGEYENGIFKAHTVGTIFSLAGRPSPEIFNEICLCF